MHIFECATCALMMQTNAVGIQAVSEQKETGAIWEEAACESDVDRAPGSCRWKWRKRTVPKNGPLRSHSKGRGEKRACLVVWYGCMTHIYDGRLEKTGRGDITQKVEYLSHRLIT